MSQETQELTIQSDQLREFTYMLYQKAGVPDEHAKIIADLQVETDLRGVYSHGTRQVSSYIQSVLDGNANPAPQLTVTQEGPSFAVIDGDNALGHPPSALAMEMAIETASKTGIAAVGVRNAGHFGAACAQMCAKHCERYGVSSNDTPRIASVRPLTQNAWNDRGAQACQLGTPESAILLDALEYCLRLLTSP